MHVDLPYGRATRRVDLPDSAVVVAPRDVPGLADERAAVTDALRNPTGAKPLRDLVGPGDDVCIVISDITRPTPNERLIPWILDELAHVPSDRFTILNGTGSHRANTREELVGMLGAEVVDTVRVVNHSAFEPADLAHVGTTSLGGEILLNRAYVEADVRISTGFIEPHFFAGFSGGPKGIMPAIAGIDSIMHFHNAWMIGHPSATWGVLDGNPLQQETIEANRFCPPHFLLNVTLNGAREITGVFAGDWLEAHRLGCAWCRETAMVPVPEPYDVVITTNGGYPLDQNLYQAVKGMSAARQVVREGGAILCVAECSDGFPSHGNFKELFRLRESPRALLEMIEAPGFAVFDQWEVQKLALIQLHADVHLCSELPAEDVSRASITPVADLRSHVDRLLDDLGPGVRVAAMPWGPFTIPYLAAGA